MKIKLILQRIYPQLLPIIGFLILIVLTFRQLPQTFYQQDEWLGSGQVLALGWKVITYNNSVLQIIFGDGRPLSRVLGALFFQYFPLQSVPLALYSIFFHFLNTILVYFIILLLLKKKFVAFLGASYFAVESISHQTVTWFAASFGAQPSSFLIFLSLLLFILFIQRGKKIFLYTSFIAAIISLYFKETGVFLFPLFVIVPFIFNRKFPVKKLLVSYIPLFVFGVIFVSYRLIEMILVRTPSQGKVYLTSATDNIISTLLIRSILYPLTSLSLTFIPQPVATFLSESLWKIYYPFIVQRPDLVFQTVVLDLISIIFSVILLVALFIIGKEKEYKKVVIFSLTFFLLTILPYIVISKDYAYLEPRYYYVSLLSSALIISLIFSYIFDRLKGFLRIGSIILVLIYLGYLRYNISVIRHDIAYQVDLASERKFFMKQLYSSLPTLTSNTNVFYFTGDESWLVDGNKTPFQNGFGYTLMVLYYKSGKIPHYLPTTEYLWMLGEQGFKDIDGIRYGYYNDLDSLKNSVKENKVNLSDVHAFFYHRHKHILEDITGKVRAELEN